MFTSKIDENTARFDLVVAGIEKAMKTFKKTKSKIQVT